MTRPGIGPTPILTYRTRSGRSTTWAIAAVKSERYIFFLSLERRFFSQICLCKHVKELSRTPWPETEEEEKYLEITDIFYF